ncbi:glycosyltransferase family 4 protein [Candidatus Peregrinibacteria bacterium]|nr:glycosyltransferase family 4 protein [Candidatus Peregrinibacteria bacterium]
MKKKIAVVIQRYGLEVNGGAELLCRQLSERLQGIFDITVLTTRALDYYSWKNHYKQGVSKIYGVTVHRFPVDFERNKKKFDDLSRIVYATPHDTSAGEKWMKEQGPCSSELFSYIEKHERDFNFFLFFTYLYATTYYGIQAIKNKKKIVLVPAAHDEPPIRLKIFDSVFHSPNQIIFNTEAERDFVHHRFDNEHIQNIVAGVGVEFPPNYIRHAADFVKKYIGTSEKRHFENENAKIRAKTLKDDEDVSEEDTARRSEAFAAESLHLQSKECFSEVPKRKGCFSGLSQYVIYAGRIDESKGCKEMFEYFLEYKKLTHSSLQLVLLGKAEMDIPSHPDIIALGFISDQDKFDAICGARFMIVPSPYESLSISLLEAFLCQKTVLVNGRCEVLKNHCVQSNGGLWYGNAGEFIEGLDYLLTHKNEREIMEKNGYQYVLQNYQWNLIIEKIKNFIL